jgi:hypothetical protein
VDILANLTDGFKADELNITSYNTWYEKVSVQPLEVIYPVAMFQPNQKNVGGMPSVLIGRETAKGKLA